MYKLIAELLTAVTISSTNPVADSSNTKVQYYYYSTTEEKSLKEEYKKKKTKYVPIRLIVQSDTITVTKIADNREPDKKMKDEIKFVGSGVWDFYEMTDNAVFIHFKEFIKPKE